MSADTSVVSDQRAPVPRSGLLRGGLGVGVATTFASAANYLSNVVLGRVLGPDEFADAALVVSGLLLLGAMALGLQLTAAGRLPSAPALQHFVVPVGVRQRSGSQRASPSSAWLRSSPTP